MPSIQNLNGQNIHFREAGQGFPLLLLHANPGDAKDFDAVFDTLAQTYRVFALDWPGYGLSPAPTPPKLAAAILFADILAEFIEITKLEKVILVGNSVGGYAAARLAITRPDRVAALILVSPGGFTSSNLFTWLFCQIKGREFVTRLVAGVFAKFYLKKRNSFVNDIIARTETGRHLASRVAVDAAIWRSFTHPAHDLRQIARRISAPTLLIFGRFDPVIRANSDGHSALKAISAAQMIVMETGHEPFAEDPAAFLQVVEPFMAKINLNQELEESAI